MFDEDILAKLQEILLAIGVLQTSINNAQTSQSAMAYVGVHMMIKDFEGRRMAGSASDMGAREVALRALADQLMTEALA